MPNLNRLKSKLNQLANKKQAEVARWFFKTGKGEYGQGDKFLGIKVPVLRQLVKEYKNLSFCELQPLLDSKIHEHRLAALFILVKQYEKADDKAKKQICEFYLKNTKNINNWDLVDLSAPNIVGNYFLDKPRIILYQLARSKNLWEKRISILATYAFIRSNDFKDTLKICEQLLLDDHDLIHKATGWMLREVGNRNRAIEIGFLKKHYKKMPRTMLRYAIEKFPEPKRKFWLKR